MPFSDAVLWFQVIDMHDLLVSISHLLPSKVTAVLLISMRLVTWKTRGTPYSRNGMTPNKGLKKIGKHLKKLSVHNVNYFFQLLQLLSRNGPRFSQ